jgi:hypothetical protein
MSERGQASVAFAEALYANVTDWYKSADLKAQVILTLNGVFVAFTSQLLAMNGRAISTPRDPRRTARRPCGSSR